MAEQWGGHEVSAETYEAMVDEVRAGLEPFERRHRIADEACAGRVQVLGSAGTVTTVVGIRLELPKYPRRAVDGPFLKSHHLPRTPDQFTDMSLYERGAPHQRNKLA